MMMPVISIKFVRFILHFVYMYFGYCGRQEIFLSYIRKHKIQYQTLTAIFSDISKDQILNHFKFMVFGTLLD
jgi:hypothetical protein